MNSFAIDDCDEHLARERFTSLAQQNFLKHAIPEAYGGIGDSFQALVKAHADLGQQAHDTGLILSLNAHLWGTVFPLITYGTPSQQEYWLPGLLNGQLIGGHAITEPTGGSSLNSIQTTATRTVSGYSLTGCKRYITNAPIAHLLIVHAQLDQRLSAFIIHKNDINACFTNRPRVSACITAPIGEVILQNCNIPHNRLLGSPGAGVTMIQGALELERAFIFAGISGIMEWQLSEINHFCRLRKLNDKSLCDFQSISHKIADMKLRLDTTHLWIKECARLKDTRKRITLASAQTKLFASEAFLQSSLDAVHILGAHGLEVGNPHAQLVNDAMASCLFSGSSEIQRNIINALSQ